MGNQWFAFKQFTVYQDRTAMKVGTDGVLIGAWATCPEKGNILDVGTGTGLIALMLAQRSAESDIYGIDIDFGAYEQAAHNFQQSPWPKRLHARHSSLQYYKTPGNHKFDLIISNPPYFNNTKCPNDNGRNLARQNKTLTLKDFFSYSVAILKNSGKIALIIPATQIEDVVKNARDEILYLQKLMYVKPTPEKPPHRIMLELGFTKKTLETNEMIIETHGRHQYSDQYKAMTQAFYI